MPKKINVFTWSALKGRLPVRVDLEKKGIDLHTKLCSLCNNQIETSGACSNSMWRLNKVVGEHFPVVGLGLVDVFNINMFYHTGNPTMSKTSKVLWGSVVWVAGYFLWKNRNTYVLKAMLKLQTSYLKKSRLEALSG